MNDDMLAFALKSTVDEIKKTCPDVSNTFIFNNNGTILAMDDALDQETATRTINAFKAVAKKAEATGELESITFYSENNRVNILQINDLSLVVASSEEPDGERTANFARILVPAVLRLTEKLSKFQPEALQTESEEPSGTTNSNMEEIGTNLEAKEIKAIEDTKSKHKEDTSIPDTSPEPLVTQLMVEDVGRFAGSNAVRIDSAVIQQWKDMYGEKQINEVEVETLSGQKLRCKYRLIGDSKLDGKGLVQMPQRMQMTLNTSKGELVTVKPVL